MHRRRVDQALIWCWVPIAAAAIAVSSSDVATRVVVAAILFLSLAHQPITLAMVYGEPTQVAQRRPLFVLAPAVLLAAIYIGLTIDFVLVALVGAAWNTQHTLMQRYGIVRIYRRKGGDRGTGRRDFHLLMSWLVATLAWVARDPRTADTIERMALGDVNQRSAEVLVDIRPYATVLFALAATYAVVSALAWLRAEARSGLRTNPAVYVYLGSTAAVFVVAVAHPVAGFVAWVGSHALEYFIIVTQNLRSRYGDQTPLLPSGSALHRAVQSPLRSLGVVVAFTAATLGLVWVASQTLPFTLYASVFFLVGALHTLYDGVIWKLRQPSVARTFALDV